MTDSAIPSATDSAPHTGGQAGGTATPMGQWMALLAALLGWMFDGAEMGIFSMVGRDAVTDLLTRQTGEAPNPNDVAFQFGVIIAIFLVGAATGGVVFGWLGDRIGRVRAMSLSVLTYALFTGFCGFARTPLELGVLRFVASLGMGGEWALGVSLVMEVWPNRSRALMAGLIGAAANAGYLLVGVIGIGLNAMLSTFADWMKGVGLSQDTVAMLVAYKGWRLMMMLGTLPAILTFFFRIFVPESHKWEEEQAKGSTSNWMTADLLGVLIGAVGPLLIVGVWSWKLEDAMLLTVLRSLGTLAGLAIATWGYMYPVRKFLQRSLADHPESQEMAQLTVRRMLLAAGLSGVALLGTWGSTQWSMAWAVDLMKGVDTGDSLLLKNFKEWTQISTALGAIVGTIAAALLGDWIGRRMAYSVLCVLSALSVFWFFQFHDAFGVQFLLSAFVLGTCTASFYGWLPLYLPELFSTKVRATGQGFGFNFGRILAAIGTLQIGALHSVMANWKTLSGAAGKYPCSCSFVIGVYVLGLILITFAPETKGKPLPE